MEQIISKGPVEMASMFIRLFDLPIHMEREQFPCAGHYDPVSWQLGNANCYKSKRFTLLRAL